MSKKTRPGTSLNQGVGVSAKRLITCHGHRLSSLYRIIEAQPSWLTKPYHLSRNTPAGGSRTFKPRAG